MADKRPVVVYSGLLKELATGDTVPLANGGTGATTAAAARTALGAVNKAGDTMTGNLTVSTSGAASVVNVDAATSQDAALFLDKGGSGRANAINAYSNGDLHWQVLIGDSTAVSGTSGSNFGIHRYNGATFLGTVLSISRSSGETTVASLSSSGAVAAIGAVTGASVGATGTVSGNSLTVGTSGTFGNNVTATGQIQAGAQYGFLSQGYFADGSNYASVAHIGNPSFETCVLYTYHVPGSWAGYRMVVGTTSPAVFEFRNGGQVVANGTALTSDRRVKDDLAPIRDAVARVRKLLGYTYRRTDMVNTASPSPTWGMRRYAGVMAQDAENALAESVYQDPPTEADPEPLRRVDPYAIEALLVNAIHEIDDRLSAIEWRFQRRRT